MKRITNIKSILLLLVVILVYWLLQQFYFRIDLTTDQRYSLSTNTKKLLKNLQHTYTIEMYLSGDLPYSFYKLQKATEDIIYEINQNAKQEIAYEQIAPNLQQEEQVNKLIERGLQYTNINIKDKNGKITQQLLFPSLILHNGKQEVAVSLLENNPNHSGQENLNNSIASLEYKLTNALRMLETTQKPTIAFLQGHEELSKIATLDFAKSLSENYNITETYANRIDSGINVLIVAQPRKNFSEDDKFAIDQYIMNGGKTLWLVDEVEVSKDSLRTAPSTMAYYKPLNIEDQLFTYGVRINPDLVLDINADLIKVNTALKGNPPKFSPMPWAYEPLLETNPTHPISKNIPFVRGVFTNSIDLLNAKNVKSTILLRTSQSSKLRKVPRIISMQEIRAMQDPNFYTTSNITVAVLQEGEFSSVFQGRMKYSHRQNFKAHSLPNKMIIISDGDIIRNETKGYGVNMQFLPLGYNVDYHYTHGNKSFLINAIDYLCDDENWMELRNKKYIPALLNKTKIRQNRSFWQWLNVLTPILFTLLIALGYNFYRKNKYRKK